MYSPVTSVLIAAYQAAQFISAALASITDQVVSDWEVIVVEDGSCDGTEAIVKAFAQQHPPGRVIYDNLGINRGVAAARNRLLELSNGKFVAFLDADDRWERNHLANLLDCLGAGHVLACTPITVWDSERDCPSHFYMPTRTQISEPRRSLFRESFIQTSSCVAMPKTTIEKVGCFDERLRIGEDRDYWFRAIGAGDTLGCTSVPSCRYVKHAGSSMAKTMLVAQQTVAFYEKHRHAEALPPFAARRHLAASLRTLGRLTRKANASDARRAFIGGWNAWPLALDLPLRALTVGL